MRHYGVDLNRIANCLGAAQRLARDVDVKVKSHTNAHPNVKQEITDRIDRCCSQINAAGSHLTQLSFDIGFDAGRDAKKIADLHSALKAVLTNLNGDLLEVYKSHPIIEEILRE